MLAPLTTLQLKVGDTTSLPMRVEDDDGDKWDVAGWTAEFSVNKGRKGGLGDWTYLSQTHPEVITLVPADDEQVKLVITPELSREWTNGKAVQLQAEVTLTDTSGRRFTILDATLDFRGEVRYEPEVTP